ncbi:MAG: NADH-quinone oxidoreductase subunit NuoE [Kiritimatiellaeota bacterium]|nr:NADH-quinone oxidoreductase subunit NuoE [Kiritimatiellota bacterium]
MTSSSVVDSSVDVGPVAEIVAAHAPFAEADIIGSLQDLQERYGYLPQPALDELARLSGLPVAKFYGVATFYAQFHLQPHGKHTVRVCRGTACHVRGAPGVMDSVTRQLGVAGGETTPDMLFSLETVACLGTCFLSPVMLVDNKYYGNLTREKAVKILEVLAASHTGKGAAN